MRVHGGFLPVTSTGRHCAAGVVFLYFSLHRARLEGGCPLSAAYYLLGFVDETCSIGGARAAAQPHCIAFFFLQMVCR